MESASNGHTPEFVFNVALAALLRRNGIEAEAEQSLMAGKTRHQVDILVDLGEHAVAIEAEFAPARTVLLDAKHRLPSRPLIWRGLAVEAVFALVYPDTLRRVPESRSTESLGACESLEFCLVERMHALEVSGAASEEGSAHEVGTRQIGSIRTLADYLHDYWIKTDTGGGVEKEVELASTAIKEAGDILKRTVARHPIAVTDSDPEATSALIWLNALLFQELLASNLDLSTLGPKHQGRRIPRPDRSGSPNRLQQQWNFILEINWWPIFHIAREVLRETPPRSAKLALLRLVDVAAKIAERGTVRRHDVAGRVFHRLLGSRKFLATNYTTIPAAVLLAGIVFDREHNLAKGMDWSDLDTYKNLRVVDPACGSGTLLMAALQEILKLRRRLGGAKCKQSDVTRLLLENALHGYDVVPAAVHLTAATLSMAETSQLIENMPLFWMPHDVKDGKARMGSLDFLRRSPGKGTAQFLALFPDKNRDPARVTGMGESVFDAYMPSACDVMIANPPFTRAGGPGTEENTDWNPLFGSVLSKVDQRLMTNVLRGTLASSPASLYAGLGSAFLVLAQECVKAGGRLAFVLPATVLTGSRWAKIRKMLVDKFCVDWVIVSHDGRTRHKTAVLPGRRWVAFSESTRIAEVLIVATRKPESEASDPTYVGFVSLRRNPDEPVDAMAISRALLALPKPKKTGLCSEILLGGETWGDVTFVDQALLKEHRGAKAGNPWVHASLSQGRLVETAVSLADRGVWSWPGSTINVPMATLSSICSLGPYHMQVKNPKQGLFDAVSTDDPMRPGHLGLWHHSSSKLTSLEVPANARLLARHGRDGASQVEMLARSGRLHIASELGHAPQRLAAAFTEEPALGFSSWITVLPNKPAPGKEEALCLWLNSTLGLLLRIVHANRPYLGRSRLPHEVARSLPVIDVDALSEVQREASRALFRDLRSKKLRGFAHLYADPVRRELDRRLFTDVLGHGSTDAIDSLARSLNREPTLTARH